MREPARIVILSISEETIQERARSILNRTLTEDEMNTMDHQFMQEVVRTDPIELIDNLIDMCFQ